MRKSIILILTAVAILATGCLGQEPPASEPETQEKQIASTATQVSESTQPTSAPESTNTPAPTATPVPESTPTPEPTPTLEPTPDQLESTKATTSTNVAPDLVSIIWHWTELREPDGESVIVDPENYVLVFDAEETINVKADCNVGHGTYALEGDHLSLGPIALTRAMCPKGSRSNQFVALLGSADTVAVDTENHKLVITLKDEAGEMVFDDAGKAKVPSDPCEQVLDVLWMWERFDDQAGQTNIAVDDSSKYTLQLKPDGTFQFKADCNVGSGTYTGDCDSNLTLQLGPSTLAECGADSLYDEYLDKLGDVVSIVMDEDKLVLNLKADTGNMVFGQ